MNYSGASIVRIVSDFGSTILESLERAAIDRPDGLAIELFSRAGQPTEALSWFQLWSRVRSVSSALRHRHPRGARILVMLPAGPDFLTAFLGVLRAEQVAVPVPAGRWAVQAERTEGVAADCEVAAVIGLPDQTAPSMDAVSVGALVAEGERGATLGLKPPDPGSLAFLQYTSGSTGNPKGVCVEHGHLEANLAQAIDAFHFGPRAHSVTWLPPSHDMGLIGGLLVPVRLGIPISAMAPKSFIRRPLEWLKAISLSDRLVFSGGPNFCFAHAERVVSWGDAAQLDLSNWRQAFCGAEPIDPGVLRRFTAKLKRAKLDPVAITPCYGLAETCLLAASKPQEQDWGVRLVEPGDDGLMAELAGREIVCVGAPAVGTEITIRERRGPRPLPVGRVGEVTLSGPSVTRGYWNRPKETERTFPTIGGERVLRTGDLGFLDEKGMLYITGRAKELCIVRGRNLYPNELEAAAEAAHPNLRRVYAVSDAGRLVLLAEVERRGPAQRRTDSRPQTEDRRGGAYEPGSAPVDFEVIVRAIRERLVERCDVGPDEVAFLRPRLLPTTTSGKRRRTGAYESWREGKIPSLHHWVAESSGSKKRSSDFPTDATPPPDFLRRRLRRIIAQLAAIEEDDIQDSTTLLELGMDSIKSIELGREIEKQFAVVVAEDLVIDADFSRLHLTVAKLVLGGGRADPDEEFDDVFAGPRAVTPGERSIWTAGEVSPHRDPALHHRFRSTERYRLDALPVALEMLVDLHPALRTSYDCTEGDLSARERAWVPPSFEMVSAEESEVEGVARRLFSKRFDLSSPPLLRAAVIRTPDADHLCLSTHHIATDFHSLSLLWKDFSRAYSAAMEGKRVASSASGAGPRDFFVWQRWYMASEAGQRARRHWETVLARSRKQPLLLSPDPEPQRGTGEGRVVSATIAGVAAELGAAASRLKTSLPNLLLTSLQIALGEMAGASTVPVAVTYVARGRARFDDVVGYFVNVVPRCLEVRAEDTLGSLAVRNEDEGRKALANRHFPVEAVGGGRAVSEFLFSFEAVRSGEDEVWSEVAAGVPGTTLPLGGIDCELVPEARRPTDFVMELTAGVSRGNIHCSWVARDSISGAALSRLERRFVEIVRLFTASSDTPVDDVSNPPLGRLAHWRGELQGLEPLTLNPHAGEDRPASGAPPVTVHLPQELAMSIEGFATSVDASTVAVWLALFSTLLGRLGRQEVIPVGVLGIASMGEEFEKESGKGESHRARPLVLRLDTRGRPDLVELTRRTGAVMRRAARYGDADVEGVASTLGESGGNDFRSFFRAMMTVGAPGAAPSRAAACHLRLALTPSATGIAAALHCDPQVFPPEAAQRLSARLSSVASGWLGSPEGSAPSMWAHPSERTRVEQWSRPSATTGDGRLALSTAYDSERAVDGPDGHRTYAELRQRASGWSQTLLSHGVSAGDRVGVYLDRTVQLPDVVWGIWQLGACFVPLDRGYPQQRLAGMLLDAAPALVVTRREWLGDLPSELPTVTLEDCEQAREAFETRDVPAESPAYLIFTSGSSGKPKGVSCTYGMLRRLTSWQRQATNEEVGGGAVSQFAPSSFDVFVQEVALAHTSGRPLAILGDEARQDPRRLAERLEEWSVSQLFIPFVALDALVHSGAPRPRGLREVVVAGEALRVTPEMRSWFGAECRLINQYGPTETHVVTASRLPSDSAKWALLPSIGRAVAGASAMVLDAELRHCPVGVPGELFIGGSQLANGYWGRAGLTAERFIPSPHGAHGSRMYATGDLARWATDGSLEFLGRADSQVKVRGYRIELGEVEAVLEGQAGVRQAACVARGGLLHGYVVSDGVQMDAERVLDAVRPRLPEYMVPSSLTFLEALPLTPSGKLDRRALPDPELLRSPYQAPEGDTENALAAIWRDLLNVQAVGREDDFFALGGHSLLATRLVARVRSQLGLGLELRAVFESPRLREMASGLVEVKRQRSGPAGFAARSSQRARLALVAAGVDAQVVDDLDDERVAELVKKILGS